MSYKFSDLLVGDMFIATNVRETRWIKISTTDAIIVTSKIYRIGHITILPHNLEVKLLYSPELQQ